MDLKCLKIIIYIFEEHKLFILIEHDFYQLLCVFKKRNLSKLQLNNTGIHFKIVMKELNSKTVESSELVEQTFDYWFKDHGHIRSPFPLYIQPLLKQKSTEAFFKWAASLDPKAKDEVNDVIVGEKFEEIIFQIATELVATEDEKITILYPFLPRKGDNIEKENNPESIVVDRQLMKEGDHSFLKVKLKNNITQELWETKFELPV